LSGGDVPTLASAYQSLRPHRPLELHRRWDLPQLTAARQMTSKAIRRSRLEDTELRLSTVTPAAALILRSTPGDGLVEFDLDVVDGDGTEQVQIDVDAVPAFVTQARFPVPSSGRYVMLADGGPGEHLLTARLITTRRRAGDGLAGGGSRTAGVGAPQATITNVTTVNWAGAGTGSSFQHIAAVTFFTGAAAGSLATLFTLLTTGWTVKVVLAWLTRRRRPT
jgi:hypothetical protein